MFEFAAIRAAFSSISTFWSFVPKPVKIILYLMLFCFIGFIWGRHVTTVKYEAVIQQSIAEGKRIDKEANQTAFNNMQQEKSKWQQEALEAQNKLAGAAAIYAQMKEKCESSEQFIKDNNEIDQILTNKKEKERKSR